MNEGQNKTRWPGFLTLGVMRDVVIILLLCIIGWKLLNADLGFDLSAFSFSDLLALILAIFSISLSVAFYFKATDTSNHFYDNSYKFTKEMSEILGRIEAGFGERLRHLDEGYTGIRDKFDRLPHEWVATKAEVKKEEEEVKKKEKEQTELLENLAKRAKLAEGEKQEIFSQLAKKSDELEQARMELRRLRASQHPSVPRLAVERDHVLRYLIRRIKEFSPPGIETKTSPDSIKRIFAEIKDDLPRGAIRDLERFSMLDEDGNLNNDAIMRLRIEMKRRTIEPE